MDVKLVMFKRDGQRKDFALKSKAVIGRSPDSTLRIPISNISRRHCEIAIDGNEIWIEDLGSSNGTFVNAEKIEKALLKAGDRIVVGQVIFTVQVDGKPEEIEPIRLTAKPKKNASMDSSATIEDDVFAALELNMDEEDLDGNEISDIDPLSALEAMSQEDDDKDDTK